METESTSVHGAAIICDFCPHDWFPTGELVVVDADPLLALLNRWGTKIGLPILYFGNPSMRGMTDCCGKKMRLEVVKSVERCLICGSIHTVEEYYQAACRGLCGKEYLLSFSVAEFNMD